MRLVFPFCATLFLLNVGCSKTEAPKPVAKTVIIKRASDDNNGQSPYIAALMRTQGNGQSTEPASEPDTQHEQTQAQTTTEARSEGGLDVPMLNAAIQAFILQEGRNPKTLHELVTKQIMAQLPDPPPGTKFDYDSSSGTVKAVPK